MGAPDPRMRRGLRWAFSEGGKRLLSPEEEIEIIICYYAGLPIKDIADYYIVSRMTIHRVLKKYDLTTERKSRAK